MTDTTKQQTPTIAFRYPDLPRRPAGIAPNPYLGPHWQDPEPEPEADADTPATEITETEAPVTETIAADPIETDPARIAAELGHTLQLSRAGALALTRLQLAIKCNDRHAAMAAMDRLHAVDAEMERMVDRLPAPAERDPQRAEWEAIARHLADQKLSLAFEKLAMVSEISGPDMVSPKQPGPARPTLVRSEDEGADADATGDYQVLPARRAVPRPVSPDEPPLADWPRLAGVEPSEWSLPAWAIGLAAALLTLAALAAAVVFMTGG